MEHSSQRELIALTESPISQVMVQLTAALTGTGPALGFGSFTRATVPKPVAVVVCTSGSTGGQKEVGLTASALLASARASNEFLSAKPGQTWSLLLPLNHVAGVNVLVRSLELGTTPLDLRTADEYPSADFTAIVPTQLFRALNGDAKLLKHLKGCKAVLVGGASLPQQIARSAAEQGVNIVRTYGMSETCGGCVYNGVPLKGVDIQTQDGIIKIAGPIIAFGYLNDMARWERSFVNDWFITNDLGEITDGTLRVFGRADDVIISGGENVSLSAIENALIAHFKQNEFSAFALPDAEWGNALHVAIAGEHPLSMQEVSSYLEKELGVVAKPKGFLILSSLPFIGVGKVDRNALVQAVIDGRA